jgi:CRP/FNR family nitrogen fixation transcriptional regulator
MRPSAFLSPLVPSGTALPEPPLGGASGRPVTVYGRGQEIYGEGAPANRLFRVIFGAVRLYRLLPDGRRQIGAFYLPGEVFGFEAKTRHRFFAEAILSTGLETIPPSADPEFTRALLSVALSTLARTQLHLEVLGRQMACERVAAFLVDIAERSGGERVLTLPMQRADIGDYLGLTVETVSRIFSKMKEAGLIRLPNSRRVEILDETALRRLGGNPLSWDA